MLQYSIGDQGMKHGFRYYTWTGLDGDGLFDDGE
jgi:hypothetical protein